MSCLSADRCRRNSSSGCATTPETSKPPRCNSCSVSSASCGLSSTSRTRSLGLDAGCASACMLLHCRIDGHRALIDYQPVQANLLHDLAELVEIDGLLYIAVGAQVVAFDQIALFLRRSQNDYRDGVG